MHKNLLWQAFLLVIFIAALWYSIIALYSYYSYSYLEAQTTMTSINWNIEEKSPEEYFLKASYHYNFKGNTYQGFTLFADTPYRNPYAAEQAIKEKSLHSWKLWFDPHDPHHSSLQKIFPLKECISATFLWGLLLYFLWLGFYVAKFKN